MVIDINHNRINSTTIALILLCKLPINKLALRDLTGPVNPSASQHGMIHLSQWYKPL